MYKLSLYFLSLFVLFFACTEQADTDSNGQKGFKSIAPIKKEAKEDIPIPEPIAPPSVPASPVINTVPQAAQKDLKYPKEFKEMGVAMFKGAGVLNNILLNNNQGKFGRRIKLTSEKSFETIMDFYAKDLVKQGWTKNDQMDRVKRDEHVTYFSTNYTKDNYTLMHSVTGLGEGKVDIMQILKEN